MNILLQRGAIEAALATLLAGGWSLAEFERALTVLAEADELTVKRAARREVGRGDDNGDGWYRAILADEIRRLAGVWRAARREGRAMGLFQTITLSDCLENPVGVSAACFTRGRFYLSLGSFTREVDIGVAAHGLTNRELRHDFIDVLG